MDLRAVWIGVGALSLVACEAVPGPRPGPFDPAGNPSEEAAPVVQDMDCGTVVPIQAADTAEGVARERAWLAENFPGAQVLNESQDRCGEIPVDRVVFVHDGVQRTVLFDTTSFYGRVDGENLDDLLDG